MAFKNLGEKGALAYPGTAEIFSVPPIISGMGKVTKFKFGRYIHRVHPSKSPLKICEKRKYRRIQKPFKNLREEGAWACPGSR